jgi:hypothetical protein
LRSAISMRFFDDLLLATGAGADSTNEDPTLPVGLQLGPLAQVRPGGGRGHGQA